MQRFGQSVEVPLPSSRPTNIGYPSRGPLRMHNPEGFTLSAVLYFFCCTAVMTLEMKCSTWWYTTYSSVCDDRVCACGISQKQTTNRQQERHGCARPSLCLTRYEFNQNCSGGRRSSSTRKSDQTYLGSHTKMNERYASNTIGHSNSSHAKHHLTILTLASCLRSNRRAMLPAGRPGQRTQSGRRGTGSVRIIMKSWSGQHTNPPTGRKRTPGRLLPLMPSLRLKKKG